jgi:hypothetical protein
LMFHQDFAGNSADFLRYVHQAHLAFRHSGLKLLAISHRILLDKKGASRKSP